MVEQVRNIPLAPTIIAPPVAAAPVTGMPTLDGTALKEQRLDIGRNEAGNSALLEGVKAQTIPGILNAQMPASALPQDSAVAGAAMQHFANENKQFAAVASSSLQGIKSDTSIADANKIVTEQAAAIAALRRSAVSGIVPQQVETKASENSLNRPTDALGISGTAPKPNAGAAITAAVVETSASPSDVSAQPTASALGHAIETAPLSMHAESRKSPMAVFAADVLDAIPEVIAASFGRKASAEPAFAEVKPKVTAAKDEKFSSVVTTPAAANAAVRSEPAPAAIGYAPAVPMQTIDRDGEKITAVNSNIGAANENKPRPAANPRGDSISMGMGR